MKDHFSVEERIPFLYVFKFQFLDNDESSHYQSIICPKSSLGLCSRTMLYLCELILLLTIIGVTILTLHEDFFANNLNPILILVLPLFSLASLNKFIFWYYFEKFQLVEGMIRKNPKNKMIWSYGQKALSDLLPITIVIHFSSIFNDISYERFRHLPEMPRNAKHIRAEIHNIMQQDYVELDQNVGKTDAAHSGTTEEETPSTSMPEEASEKGNRGEPVAP